MPDGVHPVCKLCRERADAGLGVASANCGAEPGSYPVAIPQPPCYGGGSQALGARVNRKVLAAASFSCRVVQMPGAIYLGHDLRCKGRVDAIIWQAGRGHNTT